MLIGFIAVLITVIAIGAIAALCGNKINFSKINAWAQNHKVVLCLLPFIVALAGLIIILIVF